MSQDEELVWHYTTGENFLLIVECGEIRPATALVAASERSIVWFSAEPYWEPTACKFIEHGGQVVRLNMVETAQRGGGLARFGVRRDVARHSWRELKEESGMSEGMATALASVGEDQGASPSMWFGCFDPVTDDEWSAVEILGDSAWVRL